MVSFAGKPIVRAAIFVAVSITVHVSLAADPSTLIIPVLPPSCWNSPTFQRPIVNGQNNVDLLAGAYDWVVPTRSLSVTPSSAESMPPSCHYISGKGLSFWQASDTSITHYWQCTGNGCSPPCSGNITAAYPPTQKIMQSCTQDMYQILSPGAPLTPYTGNNDPYSRFLVKDYFDPSTDSQCSGPVIRRQLVRVYDQCTKILTTSTQPSYSLYAISSISQDEMVQKLCSDSICANCTVSQSVSPWKISSGFCSRIGLEVTKGMYMYENNVSKNVTGPSSSGTAAPGSNPTASGDIPGSIAGSSSLPQDSLATASSTSSSMIGVAVGVPLGLVCLCALTGAILIRRHKSKQNQKYMDENLQYSTQKEAVYSHTNRTLPHMDFKLGSIFSKKSPARMSSTKRATAHAVFMQTAQQQADALDSTSTLNVGTKTDIVLTDQEMMRYRTLLAQGCRRKPRVVMIDYQHTKSDELDLTIGDHVVLMSMWEGGWGQGYNLTTGQKGIMAALAVSPDLTEDTDTQP
ncbi:hypothetical protein BATDEDRAFT_25475 [Batrachochytrium dendrobatidis JAM81]|uniref:SH3 domain-containing protein n=1 Tax=Batrachochytrium dendrobatidis (strain JAM81 / FGSC 10211) TaxID=684364 RepID=F4P464_BATDJ|nr:uncharacterized protein BATDEDRAFT_25475 [Batrachochytrium dendrobatidis JAM81]EGF79732.1 hypothetical protein BATDEDRAFT_25475 [Batrachochytrium dendrobatidis JAM81]|eukprot:XP_006679462.1 hypothetical protein BATDEDRAFT_25475 [Batrachochytrium dendrobatidis JAM81]